MLYEKKHTLSAIISISLVKFISCYDYNTFINIYIYIFTTHLCVAVANDWWQLVGCYEYNIDQSHYLLSKRIRYFIIPAQSTVYPHLSFIFLLTSTLLLISHWNLYICVYVKLHLQWILRKRKKPSSHRFFTFLDDEWHTRFRATFRSSPTTTIYLYTLFWNLIRRKEDKNSAKIRQNQSSRLSFLTRFQSPHDIASLYASWRMSIFLVLGFYTYTFTSSVYLYRYLSHKLNLWI